MAAEITQIDTQDFTSQIYEGQDVNLISTFELNTSLNSSSYIEYFIYDNNRNLLTSDYNFTQYTTQNDGQSAGNNGDISQIIINPEQSLIDNGFDQGEYITYFNFFNKKIGSELQQLYIAEISSDRTEIRLDSTSLSNLDIIEQTNQFIQERENSTYFLDFYLNFGDNNLIISNNIQLDSADLNDPTILIKLYESLPEEFNLNSTLWVVTTFEESSAYQVIFEDEPITFIDFENISGPNFNIDLKDRVNNSTQNLSYSDLFITSLTSSQNQLNSLLEEKELDINVDYTSFENFIHFSSAQTRLENFYYKIQLIEQYSSSIVILNNTTNSSSSISSSAATYESKIDSIITNFDGYEYYLYYETGSTAWPKTNTQKPYTLATSDSPQVLTWLGTTDYDNPYYGGLIVSASEFDNGNKDNLFYTIPEYLREDPTNDQYLLFIDMVGQHYDNIWIYYKDVTQKYNADNRLEYGISKDIVADAIRDFGIKLYQNNFSNQDLYTAFLGITPEGGLFPFPNITGSLPTPSGFEYVDTLISASNDYLPLDDVNKSLYKRIYHNLPYLLKSKGTLPGLRALITSYGIPDTILRINEYGGKDKVDSNDWDYWQNEFNYAFDTEGTNFISSSFTLNSNWNSSNNKSSTIEFRFKAEEFPPTNLSQSLLRLNGGELTLQYTGSGLTSGSYSGSIIDPYYQYANLTFYPSSSNLTTSASLYLPFFNEGWWSVMLTSGSNGYKLHAGNKIYEGGDNNTALGFYSSSSITSAYDSWNSTNVIYFATGSLFNKFSGSLQEIRYYTTPLSESVFKDYIMNPNSIEGNSLNSSPKELAFRAPLGGELYTGSISIHPKITGSWSQTQSFSSNSNFYFDQIPTFTPNTEYFFYDQPIAGIKNTISDKIRIENNVIPEGDTLSPFMSLSQMANISQSYTQNINYLEVAFSPQNEINEDIMSQIGSFNIGEYIGDPRLRSSSAESYPALDQLRNEYFTKYIKNYNLTDFIRLIKFFDNSLFKMIKDFVPARTSLASGIVIKQHLLERNKYPQPQVSWEDLDISGTLKPTWNGYEEGTVENFEGGTGGTFNPFNLVTNVSQSWTESINTISGSVLVIHNSQDEFYNGELSGSNILISDGILNPAYPNNNISFNYKHVYYYGINQDQTDIFQSNFLNSLTSPHPGEILFYNYKFKQYFSNPTLNTYTTTYIKIAKTDCDGKDNSLPLGQITKLYIFNPNQAIVYPSNYSLQFDKYDVVIDNEYPDYYLYKTLKDWDILSNIGPIIGDHDNQVFDYTVSSSITASYNMGNGSPKTIINWNSTLVGTNLSHYNTPYFNTSSGILTFENTPNVPLILTASFSITSNDTVSPTIISSGSEFILIRNGEETVLQSFPLNTNSTTSYTFSSSLYPIKNDQYYFRVKRDGSPTVYTLTVNNAQLYLYQYWNNFNLDTFYGPSTSSCAPTILEPYITTANFYNSDENALLNDVFELRDSSYYMDVDYSSGITTPVNFNTIISESATRAKVQDSNYTTLRHIIPRYLGSRSTSQLLNTWSPPNTIPSYQDTGTYGKTPTVESLKTSVAYGEMSGGWPPERMNASSFRVIYLIDENGNVSIPDTSENSLFSVQGNFQSGERFRISSPNKGNGEATPYRNIIRGGSRIEPILYTQSGSAPNAQWNTTMSFEDIIPSSQGAVGNYTALFNNTTFQFITTPNSSTLVNFANSVYGSSYLFSNGYRVPINANTDGVNLVFDISIFAFPRFNISMPILDDVEISLYNTTTNTLIASVISNTDGSSPINLSSVVIPNSQIQTNDEYKVYVKFNFTENPAVSLIISSLQTSFKVSQYPSYTQPITSSGTNSIWGFLDKTNYPYIITSSNPTLIELYDVGVKQVDIIGSGFNPISLPWSIKYGDEFRFEGREDFVYQVGKIYPSSYSGSGRISQTGSIEVHFHADLPVSASSSVFNLDHFLIRRYVDDASQIIFEGFRPINSTGPYVLTPEYVTPSLNKNVDDFITILTEKGLL
jgi:hypothetical protein